MEDRLIFVLQAGGVKHGEIAVRPRHHGVISEGGGLADFQSLLQALFGERKLRRVEELSSLFVEADHLCHRFLVIAGGHYRPGRQGKE